VRHSEYSVSPEQRSKEHRPRRQFRPRENAVLDGVPEMSVRIVVMLNVLSIQSWVSFGHVGNAAAIFPLQRMGIEVASIHTVQFSNHTGYGAWRGAVYAPESITELVQGMAERGALENIDGVLSGYMGSAGTIEAVRDAVSRVRRANPNALYCCDPVMGDYGRGVFVQANIPDAIKAQAIQIADIVTPNQFELELLTGQTIETLPDALAAARALRETIRMGGSRIVLLTSLVRQDAAPDTIETLAVTGDAAYLVGTPMIPLDPPRNGTGDAIAALFFGHYLKTRDAKTSLENAVSALYRLLEITHEAGTREIQLVAAQDEFVEPTRVFEAMSV
jgi:pyridoxine kinase